MFFEMKSDGDGSLQTSRFYEVQQEYKVITSNKQTRSFFSQKVKQAQDAKIIEESDFMSMSPIYYST